MVSNKITFNIQASQNFFKQSQNATANEDIHSRIKN